MPDIQIVDDSKLTIKEGSHILIDEGSKTEVWGNAAHPFYIQELQNIAPIATHIKEVNHIDPISVEALYVSQVRNIEPLVIEKFNVTNLPQVNLSLRQLPQVDLHVRSLPAVSLGTHQCFDLPSNYTLRAQFLGVEVLRLHLAGCTQVVPRERFRREQARTASGSAPAVATAGNPAIPSFRRKKNASDSRDGCQHAGISFGPAESGISFAEDSGAGPGKGSVSNGG